MTPQINKRDYRLSGGDGGAFALNDDNLENTVEANWWHPEISRTTLKELMKRGDIYAALDFSLWIFLLILSGYFAAISWQTWWAIPAFLLYGTVYSSADARWHECGHGTPFKTRWLNEIFYHLCSFMTLREAFLWRWSHARHHTNTYIVGLDPEIQVKRPADLLKILLDFFYIMSGPPEVWRIICHAFGKANSDVRNFVPEAERWKMYWSSRVYVGIFVLFAIWSWWIGSILPLMFIGLPRFYGGFLHQLLGLTQHAGLGEDTYDHRENTRTIYINPIFQYLYMNMNYHLEHHVIPMVPYYALPRLHEAIKLQTPSPYPNLWAVYAELIPALIKQAFEDENYTIQREIPKAGTRVAVIEIPMGDIVTSSRDIDNDPELAISRLTPAIASENGTETSEFQKLLGWVEACMVDDLDKEEVISFTYNGKLYAIYRLQNNDFYATDGLCTHEKADLTGGLVIDACIECPRHNGRFKIANGKAVRSPARKDLRSYSTEVRDGRVYVHIPT